MGRGTFSNFSLSWQLAVVKSISFGGLGGKGNVRDSVKEGIYQDYISFSRLPGIWIRGPNLMRVHAFKASQAVQNLLRVEAVTFKSSYD